MSVYVDDLAIRYPTKRWPYPSSCHLIADSVDELDAFAKSIGLKARWRQNGSTVHYDLTAAKREAAVRAGAIELERDDFVRKLHGLRQRNADTWQLAKLRQVVAP